MRELIRRIRDERRGTRIGHDPREQLCGLRLRYRQHARVPKIVHQRARGAQGQRHPRQRGARQAQVRLDLADQFVAQEHRPAPGEGQRCGSRTRRLLFRAPPGLERAEEGLALRGDAAPVQAPVRCEPQGGRRLREQQARLAQGAGGGAVEEERVTLGEAGGKALQHCRRHVELTDDGSARGRAALRQAQALKRRKISEPLVPPKPKEFESATSIFILRAVLGT